ncbi:transcription elongation factor S-II [Gyrodon lividus]|nr:transcription elongation factor S-II [Gyrodon lividus]
MTSSRQLLLDAAKCLCDDFAQKKIPEILLSHFSETHPCTAVEHGLPAFAPFLNRSFNGRGGVLEYFSTIASLLTHKNMRFSEYFVDTEARKVSVMGMATFTWISTEESWDETFTYVLDFDDENKVTGYQVWADTGAAYLASKGQLKEVVGA